MTDKIDRDITIDLGRMQDFARQVIDKQAPNFEDIRNHLRKGAELMAESLKSGKEPAQLLTAFVDGMLLVLSMTDDQEYFEAVMVMTFLDYGTAILTAAEELNK